MWQPPGAHPDCIACGCNSGMEQVVHPFPAYTPKDSQILILGSFPSVKSREQMFFYGHPQNRFWKVIAAIYHSPVPETIQEKCELLDRNRIALWDVIQSCTIHGSSDSSISDVVPNDLKFILERFPIQAIYANGKTAEFYYTRYQKQTLHRDAILLPSTSPANARFSLEQLITCWQVIRTDGDPSIKQFSI